MTEYCECQVNFQGSITQMFSPFNVSFSGGLERGRANRARGKCKKRILKDPYGHFLLKGRKPSSAFSPEVAENSVSGGRQANKSGPEIFFFPPPNRGADTADSLVTLIKSAAEMDSAKRGFI